MNNVFGARLRITTLHAAAGPGIELLKYLTPRDGRPGPPDARANDLAHWQMALVAGDAEACTGCCAGVPAPAESRRGSAR